MASPAATASFDLSEEHRAILETADRFGRNELYPLAPRMDAEEWWPGEIFPLMGRNGFLGVTVPGEYGGAESDLLSAGLILQAFSRWNHALGLGWGGADKLWRKNIFRD